MTEENVEKCEICGWPLSVMPGGLRCLNAENHPDQKAGDAFDAKWTDAVGEFLKNQGVPIEEHLPDEALPGPRLDSVEDAEANLIYSVEGVRAEPDPIPEPIPPKGVVLHFTNGQTQKVELVYTGLDLNGIHIWEVTTHPRFADVEKITIEGLPPMTQIHMGGPGGP